MTINEAITGLSALREDFAAMYAATQRLQKSEPSNITHRINSDEYERKWRAVQNAIAQLEVAQ